MRRVLLGATTVVTALLLQSTVVARLPLPGGAPDLLLVLVVAFALVEGARSGVVTGFLTGLLADLSADHALGRLALVYALAGYLTGLLHDDRPRSVLTAPLAVAAATGGAVTVFALEGLLLGDPRITSSAFWTALSGTVAWSAAAATVVVPVVAGLVRRVDADPLA